ncbi:VWA domain protein interacting with AAA ATPase [Bacteroidales bacterium Barb6]|nr:VWA domain protein interacting with AAA ATPase [Bacteroidales bacterium Barb6]
MSSLFSRFEAFGLIADEAKRKQLAESVCEQLQNNSESNIALSDRDTDNFSTAVNKIVSYGTMKELCAKDPELAEEITCEVLDFINKTKKQINRAENPFEKEQSLYNEFEQTQESSFEENWNAVCPFIKKVYGKQDLDTDFYDKEFQKSLAHSEKEDKHRISFESVKEHFMEKWNVFLFKKQTDRELKIIDEQRKKFCEELYKRIDELKRLQEVLAPFTNELGRLWDMSKGYWQKINLDVLKKYVELLQQDKSLQELAEMLGRMRQTEKEYEEELFTDTVIKQEWKVEHASKADLIGVHESDDISSLLPSETALLADETTELIFYRKFAEKKLQTFEYQAKSLEYIEEEFRNKKQKAKEEAQGPFIICIDTSGSMHGTPETVAKTLCLALLKTAVRENRKCYLISFSTGIQTLNLNDLKNSLDEIIRFLSMSFQGGTDAASAMREALRMLTTEDYKKADIIMVSDFVMPAFDEQTQSQIKTAKENKTKFHNLVIGSSGNTAAMKEFDNNWFYDINKPDSLLTLVKNIRGIQLSAALL